LGALTTERIACHLPALRSFRYQETKEATRGVLTALEKICATRSEGTCAVKAPLEGQPKKKFEVSCEVARWGQAFQGVHGAIAFLLDISLKFFFDSKKCTHARIFGESALGGNANVFQGSPDTSVVVANFDIMFETIYFMKNFV
jgi:hypothetical protein